MRLHETPVHFRVVEREETVDDVLAEAFLDRFCRHALNERDTCLIFNLIPNILTPEKNCLALSQRDAKQDWF